jgi:uncharacterized membrane-anchored protein YhcB (DUF1043 family)
MPDRARALFYADMALRITCILAILAFLVGFFILFGGWIADQRQQIKEEMKSHRSMLEYHQTQIVQERQAFAREIKAFDQMLADHQRIMSRFDPH